MQRSIAELAVKHDLYVLSDEIYARIIYGDGYISMMSYPGMAERTLIIDGFSKSFAMTGWRLGYTIAPPDIVPHLVMLAVNSYTCTAEFTQYAAIEALRDRDGATPRMVAEFRKRRDQFAQDLNRVPGFRCQLPEGAFYAWVNISGTGTERRGGVPHHARGRRSGSDSRASVWGRRQRVCPFLVCVLNGNA